MTAPNPTAAPTLALPIVHVHGATSMRRRVCLGLLAAVPAVPVLLAAILGPPQEAPVGAAPGMAFAAAVWLVLALRSFPPMARWTRHASATVIGIVWAVGAAAATMERDALSWAPWAVAVIVAATLVGTWAAWGLGGLRFGVVWPLVRPPRAAATPTARSAWSETGRNAPHLVGLLVLGCLGLIFCVAAGFSPVTAPWLLPLSLFALLAALPCAIRITADRRGLRIRSRILGIPLVTVPLDRIASASAALIDETEWGQVGSTADRELTTIIHRSGAALIVTRIDGSMVVVTVDRPDLAAAVLESLRAQLAHG